MKTAILMSAYNGEKYIREQIDSILNQKVNTEYDLIVRDDGSTDSTREILEEYASRGKLSYVSGPNIGAAKSFISLLCNHPGYDYYAFSDQDDYWHEEKLQRGIDAVSGCGKPALYCANCELVDADLKSLGRNTHRAIPNYTLVSILCLASCAQGCTAVFNQELARIVQENEVPEVFIMHDSLLTSLSALADGTIIYDHRSSMKYRMHGDNVFGMVSSKQNAGVVIHERLKEIFTKRTVSMYDQTRSLLKAYGGFISDKNRKVCETVIDSEVSMSARLKLVFDKKLRHDTLNMTLTKKLEILFGND